MNVFQVGTKIIKLREGAGLTQAQLADMVKVDPSLICKIEKGKTEGSIGTLRKIAVVLGIPFGKLIDDTQKAG